MTGSQRRIRAEEDHAGLRCGLEPGGDVDGVTCQPPRPGLARRPGDEDLTRVHPHAHAECVGRQSEVGGDGGHGVDDGKGRRHRVLGVLVPGVMDPEGADDRVADELLDLTGPRLDGVARRAEVLGLHDGDVLGVEPLRESGETDEVGEQDGDDPSFAGEWPGLG